MTEEIIKMDKAFEYIFKLFCLFGCLFQICQITRVYISYETTTEVKYEIDSTISLQYNTICFWSYTFLFCSFDSNEPTVLKKSIETD